MNNIILATCMDNTKVLLNLNNVISIVTEGTENTVYTIDHKKIYIKESPSGVYNKLYAKDIKE